MPRAWPPSSARKSQLGLGAASRSPGPISAFLIVACRPESGPCELGRTRRLLTSLVPKRLLPAITVELLLQQHPDLLTSREPPLEMPLRAP